MSLRRFAVAAILAICIGGPIVEMFDQWDHSLQDGNDTETNVVVAGLCIGVAMAIGTIAVVARHSGVGLDVPPPAGRGGRRCVCRYASHLPGPYGQPSYAASRLISLSF